VYEYVVNSSLDKALFSRPPRGVNSGFVIANFIFVFVMGVQMSMNLLFLQVCSSER
jgi:hypothetical protein